MNKFNCTHCGLEYNKPIISDNGNEFCCKGCQIAWGIIHDNNLCSYYELNDSPGTIPPEVEVLAKYKFLDDVSIHDKILDYSIGDKSKVTFNIPSIHCSSCIWILEKLHMFNSSISESLVDFLKKQVSISYNNKNISLTEIVEILTSIGYEPNINLEKIDSNTKESSLKKLYLKIGVAGFALGNIMLLSLPEYFQSATGVSEFYQNVFRYLNFGLSLPVLFYSATEFLVSAFKSIRSKTVNMDVPISIGIIALYLRSVYEIVNQTGAGWMDSFVGLVFLLLLGKLFQEKTYQTLSFDRDFKSYFPISVFVKRKIEESIPLSKLNVGDRMIIRNGEVIPADSILINGDALIDYSFVTGESDPVYKRSGEKVFAGGKQVGSVIELDVVKPVSQSYLTQLWNQTSDKTTTNNFNYLADIVAKYFTIIVLFIASSTFLFWINTDFSLAINGFTAVLIIACPCALSLATPFTLGTTLRMLGRNQIYIKNTKMIEKISKISTIVFDKTGTLSDTKSTLLKYVPNDNIELSENEYAAIKSVAYQSTHPLSRTIVEYLVGFPLLEKVRVEEIIGRGIKGYVNDLRVDIGSASFLNIKSDSPASTSVFVRINDVYKGYFIASQNVRPGVKSLIKSLKNKFSLFLLSGDSSKDYQFYMDMFKSENMFFEQSPFDKKDKIIKLISDKNKVMMIGDGLNDAGALLASDVGVSITEDVNTFSPACDVIIKAEQFKKLDKLVQYTKTSVNIIKASYIISLLYNIIGIYFAVQGTLSPLISAILMPLSSITVVSFATSTAIIASPFKRR